MMKTSKYGKRFWVKNREKYNPEGENTAKVKLTEAFRILRGQGFITKQNFMCCRSCAGAELANICEKRGIDPDTVPFVTYTHQDNEGAEWTGGELVGGLYITWGEDMEAHAKICAAFDTVGLAYNAPENLDTRFELLPTLDPKEYDYRTGSYIPRSELKRQEEERRKQREAEWAAEEAKEAEGAA